MGGTGVGVGAGVEVGMGVAAGPRLRSASMVAAAAACLVATTSGVGVTWGVGVGVAVDEGCGGRVGTTRVGTRSLPPPHPASIDRVTSSVTAAQRRFIGRLYQS
ncbi:MAG: hypothetical protein O6920_05730 [Chloroflexi bacterium]|nr:hypothetical protein [Chloroflexota bacterium]